MSVFIIIDLFLKQVRSLAGFIRLFVKENISFLALLLLPSTPFCSLQALPSLNPRWRLLDQNALARQNKPALQAITSPKRKHDPRS